MGSKTRKSTGKRPNRQGAQRSHRVGEYRDLYQEVTDRIVAALEQGTAPWVRPWESDATGALAEHRNAHTGRPYSGINILLLWIESLERDYTHPLWLTYKQAQQMGGNVRKGEKGTRICFFKPIKKTVVNGNGKEEDRSFALLRAYTVFNVEQCDDLPDKKLRNAPPAEFVGNAECEAVIASTGATIKHGGNRAFYHPDRDFIGLPAKRQFEAQQHYYATAFHELTHWTGHKTRLDRDLRNRFGTEAYAMEELIAELGAAFLCAKLAVQGECRHPEYIANWLKVLKGDKKAIFAAASKARQAATYLAGNGAEDSGELAAAA